MYKSKGWSAAYAEMRSWFALSQVWVAMLLLGIVLSLTGAFDTHNIPKLFDRAMLFTIVIGGGGLLCVFATGVLRGSFGLSAYNDFRIAIAIGIAIIPFGAITGREIHGNLVGYDPGIAVILRSCVHGSLIVISILGIMYMVRFRSLNRERNQTALPTLQSAQQLPRYMESDDHYLKMFYATGVELIRANISDWAQRFEADGFRCHKSYWVSRQAIKTRKRQGRQLLLVLKDGTEIPVGRSYEKRVRAHLG